jgi:hypothetical protein
MNRQSESRARIPSTPLRAVPATSLSAAPAKEEGSFPAFQDAGAESIVRRAGLMGWWLNLTAPRWPAHTIPIKERERLRKAELTSFSILAIFAFLLALVSNSLANPATAQAVVLMGFFLLVAAVLNRTGRTRLAAYLIPSVLMVLLAVTIIRGPGGGLQLMGLPIYDLFAIPIVMVSLVGDRRATWVFAFAAIAFVVADFLNEPHSPIIVAPGVPPFDDINYAIDHFGGVWGAINRDVALLFFAALFGWMGARSVDHAIARADRAEEIARLEHAIAEQTRQLEQGIEALRQTHARVANGDYSARAPLGQEHILWQIAYLLNNLIQRLQRNSDAEHLLGRTRGEIDRLIEEIHRAKIGLPPLWPPPSGTPLDPLLQEFSEAGVPRRGF